ncbi:MAG TPA: 2-dehydropantoate 2-reductase [Anaerolineales bacterium]|nr:2-dehydropantoate 2-reductase [Anaerolineales bacterium]
MANLKILSFGAGAIGTYIGGSLALAGEQIVFVEQPVVAAALRQRGLRLNLTIDKRRKTNQILALPPSAFVAAPSLEDALRYGPFDAALFALKSFDTSAAVESMKPFAEKLPPILCLSNGVENESLIANALGADKVIPATVTSAIARHEAGDIVLERLRGIGLASKLPLSDRLVASARSASLNPQAFSNAAAMKWSKMLTNLIANPTSAILNMSAAEIFADRGLCQLEIRMLRECLAVMKAQKIPVVDLPGTPVRALAMATRLPSWASRPLLARGAGAGRGAKMPSFHIDLYSGRGQSEVQYLHGAVVRAGERFGVATPVNRVLTETLLKLTNGEIPLEEFAHQPQKLLALI